MFPFDLYVGHISEHGRTKGILKVLAIKFWLWLTGRFKRKWCFLLVHSGYVEKIYFPGHEVVTEVIDLNNQNVNNTAPVPSNSINEPECEIEMIE